MSRQLRRWIIGVALTLGLAVPAAAQQDMSAEVPSRTPGWSVTPGFTLGTIFDSNVALASAPADTKRTQSDRMLLAEPFGQLEYFSRRTEFSSGYQGYLRRYADVTQLNSFDQRGYLSLRRLATRRLTFFLHETPPIGAAAAYLGSALLVMSLGWAFFQKTRTGFADVL